MSDQRPADDQYDEGWKLELLASRSDMSALSTDAEQGDGSALAALMDASGGRCWYCGCGLTYGGAGVGTSITREHQLPKARGGSNKPENIVAACRACNVSKQAKTVEEFRAYRMVSLFYGEMLG